MGDKLTALLLVIVILAAVCFAGAAFFLGKNLATNQKPSAPSSMPTQSQPTLMATPSQQPSVPTQSPLPSPTPNSNLESNQNTNNKPGWLTYTDSQYGFSISYPEGYKPLTDKENLYGWPDGLVLFYKGGQSYDIAVEVWNSEAAYKQKYPNENLTAYKLGDKFITLVDLTKEEENQEIISTFKIN